MSSNESEIVLSTPCSLSQSCTQLKYERNSFLFPPNQLKNVLLCLMLFQDRRWCNWTTVVKILNKYTEASEWGINHTLVKCRLVAHSIKTISGLLKTQHMKHSPNTSVMNAFPVRLSDAFQTFPLGPSCRDRRTTTEQATQGAAASLFTCLFICFSSWKPFSGKRALSKLLYFIPIPESQSDN